MDISRELFKIAECLDRNRSAYKFMLDNKTIHKYKDDLVMLINQKDKINADNFNLRLAF